MRRLAFVVEFEVLERSADHPQEVEVRTILRSNAHGLVLGAGCCSDRSRFFEGDANVGIFWRAFDAAFYQAYDKLGREVRP